MDDSIRPRKPTDLPPVDQAPQLTEDRLIAIDLAYHELKVSGGLQRAETDRGLRLQIERQGAAHFTNTGLCG